MIPQKTRLVFMVRMRFARVSPRKWWLQVAMILPRQLPDDPWLVSVERFAPWSFSHYFRVDDPDQLDGGMQAWVRAAYRRGTQETLFVG